MNNLSVSGHSKQQPEQIPKIEIDNTTIYYKEDNEPDFYPFSTSVSFSTSINYIPEYEDKVNGKAWTEKNTD